MAAISPNSRPAHKTYRRYALIWLLMTLVLGVATALVWMFAKTPAANARIENDPITANASSAKEIVRPTKIEPLHELDTDVQPIDFSAMVRDLREYPDEFKDKSYLIANKGKWTVQVMNVAENDVIVDYLLGREDRKKFAYFRYRDDNNQLRYMLTYGVMNSAQEASGAAKLMDFGLPSNVRVIPEEFNRYVNIIDSYELAQPVVDLGANRNRKVNLQPTRREVPVRRKVAPSSQNSSNSSAGSTDSASARGSADNTSSKSTNKSIRESEDTSKTLVVNEERIVNDEGGSSTDNSSPSETKKSDNNSNKSNSDKNTDNKPATDWTTNPPKKETANKTERNNKNSAKETNNKSNDKENTSGSAPSTNNDPIKELIEEKTN